MADIEHDVNARASSDSTARLDASIADFEAAKRWGDAVRALLQKAERVADPVEKAALFRRAGAHCDEHLGNQAEAIACFERVLELAPQDADTTARLAAMYEKRRDWEKLLRVMERRAESLPHAERARARVEMATLATARIREPDVGIALWIKVLDDDPSSEAARSALAELEARARNASDAGGAGIAAPAVVAAVVALVIALGVWLGL